MVHTAMGFTEDKRARKGIWQPGMQEAGLLNQETWGGDQAEPAFNLLPRSVQESGKPCSLKCGLHASSTMTLGAL